MKYFDLSFNNKIILGYSTYVLRKFKNYHDGILKKKKVILVKAKVICYGTVIRNDTLMTNCLKKCRLAFFFCTVINDFRK